MTVRSLCLAALQRLGVLGAGETSPSDDVTLALTRLNALIDNWRTQRLFTHALTRTVFSVVSGTATYTVGPGGDVDVLWPVFPQYIRLVDTTAVPALEVGIRVFTDAAYVGLAQKTLSATWPSGVYYNPTVPLASLTFWPVPTLSTLQGVLYTPNPSGPLAMEDELELPPGYQLAYQENLAVHLAADFERPLSPVLVESAREAMANIKRANLRLTDLTVVTPFGPGGGYDITSDTEG